MPGLFETLDEKERTLSLTAAQLEAAQRQLDDMDTLRAELQQKEAELKSANLELGEWRTSESAENLKRYMDALASEADRRTHALETCQRLARELQQANEKIQQLEREASAREARPAECEDIECHYDYPHLPRGDMCATHGLAVLVTHVDDSEPCSDYLTASRPAPEKGRSP